MCGVAGVFYFDKEQRADPKVLKRMADSLAHRGPDGEGVCVRGNMGLAHRRLAIIDLYSGDQPMVSDDQRLLIVFNGEIYNYLELKQNLIQKGHRFKTASDTEVLLHAYQEWGMAFQSKLIGMWAFAIWDDIQKKLILSRDRIGEKPLFFGKTRDAFVFGSEIKALFAYGVQRLFAPEITELYLFLGYLPAPYTFYQDIFKLKPGYCLIVDDAGVREYQYWDFPDITEKEMVRDETRVFKKFEQLFQNALTLQLRSDVPYGIFLSGGLDSAGILAGVAGVHPEPIHTITVGFHEEAYDERKLARISARAFGAHHHEFVLERDTFSNWLSAILFHFDEPFADPAAIPVGYLSRLARRKVKMALAGDGGDEVLSGYNSYQSEKLASLHAACPKWIQREASNLFDLAGRLVPRSSYHTFNRLKRVLDTSGLTFSDRLIQKFDPLQPALIKQLIPTRGVVAIEDYIHDLFRKCPFKDSFYQLMWFHFKVLLPDRMLPKIDRMSMAHGLEVRVPFLDYRIVELMYQTHKNLKMKGFTRKNVLRQTIGKKLPPSVLHAAKRGFEVPLTEWFRDDTYSAMLHEICSIDIGLDRRLVRTLVEESMTGQQDHGLFVWKLILFYRWMRSLQ